MSLPLTESRAKLHPEVLLRSYRDFVAVPFQTLRQSCPLSVKVIPGEVSPETYPEHGEAMVEPLNYIMLFTKHPTPGFAKTRLIPAVGAEQAATISGQLTERALKATRTFTKNNASTKTIIHYYAPSELPLSTIQNWLHPTASEVLRPQSTGDLGERLAASFKASFSADASKVVVIGSDCPSLTSEVLGKAFQALDDADVVIGPAEDGGYYLLGMKRLHENLFKSIPWSSSLVFQRTREVVGKEGLTMTLLQTLRDVDTSEDLSHFRELISNDG